MYDEVIMYFGSGYETNVHVILIMIEKQQCGTKSESNKLGCQAPKVYACTGTSNFDALY